MGTGITHGPMLLVVTLTRGWLHVYTRGLPGTLAEERRAEIESDLWEMQHDPDLLPGLRRAAIALVRLIAGIPDDIAWRLENGASKEQLMVRRAVAFTAAAAIVLSVCALPSFSGRLDEPPCGERLPQVAATRQLDVIRCVGAFFSFPPP